jgi:glucokinase-like ROK family protein
MEHIPVADHALLRKLNKSIILDQLHRAAPFSRAELATRTGLNRSTVSIIINELIEDGFVLETDLQSSRVGRPGRDLVLNPGGGGAIGVEIGVDFISLLLTDFIAEPIWWKRVVIDPPEEQDQLIELATEMTQQALERANQAKLRPLGIGLGVPGLVEVNQGILTLAPNLHWNNVPLRAIWTKRFNLPVFVENEANAAALGEYYYGVARGVQNFIYLSGGIGLGGGVVIHGQLFRGANGYAAEIGHISMDPLGENCGCGKRGCWETQVSPRALLRRIQHRLAGGEKSLLEDMAAGDLGTLTFECVVGAARQNDTLACTALEEIGHYLGVGIANLVNIFNPELVVLGGALNLASPFIVPAIEKTVKAYALKPSSQTLRIAASALGTDACIVGTIALVVDDILREPIFNG